MLRKLVTVERNEFTPPAGVEDHGGANGMPTPYVECTADEYAHVMGIYGPQFTEYRQVRLAEVRDGMVEVRIAWIHDRGYAVVFPKEWRTTTAEEREQGAYTLTYKDGFRYFRVGCEHDYVGLSAAQCEEYGISARPGRCYHVIRCKKCGSWNAYDSSD